MIDLSFQLIFDLSSATLRTYRSNNFTLLVPTPKRNISLNANFRNFGTGLTRLITARARSTYNGRLCFHRCVSVQLSGLGGYPNQGRTGAGEVPRVPQARSGWWGYPAYPQPGLDGGGTWGTPTTRTGWGTPPPIRQSSIASTC